MHITVNRPKPIESVVLTLTEREAKLLRILAGSVGTSEARKLLYNPDGTLNTSGNLLQRVAGDADPGYSGPFRQFIEDLSRALAAAGAGAP